MLCADDSKQFQIDADEKLQPEPIETQYEEVKIETIDGIESVFDIGAAGVVEPIPVNPLFEDFSVSTPTKNSTFISYLVEGKRQWDATNEAKPESFSVQRRYGDFEQLREMLSERWIGFFIPSIPPKQAIVSPLCAFAHFLMRPIRETWKKSSSRRGCTCCTVSCANWLNTDF